LKLVAEREHWSVASKVGVDYAQEHGLEVVRAEVEEETRKKNHGAG